jgi:cytochrome c peroxidase
MRLAIVLLSLATLAGCSRRISHKERVAALGLQLFTDENLSNPPGKSCASCHAPASSFRDPESDRSTSDGAVAGLFGFRNAPTAMYAQFAPPLVHDQGAYRGGLFWDGRANTLEQQAEGPLLNPIEMNNRDHKSVAAKLRKASYAQAFKEAFGDDALDDDERAFAHMNEALAAYERSPALAPFTSKYDAWLAGKATLSADEEAGRKIFDGKCAGCHPDKPGPDGAPPLFTDFSYGNLGIPKYRNNLYYKMPASVNPDGDRFIDHGLMKTVNDANEDGKFRTPTLRNIMHSPPYGHNGYFASIGYMLDFLNTRDVKPWPAPEVPATVDRRHVGNLGLDHAQIRQLILFLRTLSDGYRPRQS